MMALHDYRHWNEDAQHMWWQEEGRFGNEEAEYDPDDYIDDDDDDDYDDATDDEDAISLRGAVTRQRLADRQRLIDRGPFGEDAHLEADYEDRFSTGDD